jgi:opine dehydrogenase
MRVTIVGSGAGGRALAAWAVRSGHEVHLLPGRSGRLLKSRAVRVDGDFEGTYALASIDGSLGRVIRDPQLVVISVPADRHRDVVTRLSPHLTPEHTVLLCPGRTGGFFEARETIAALGAAAPVIFESSTLPFACRLGPNQDLQVFGTKAWVSLAGASIADRSAHVRRVSALHESFTLVDDVMETSLQNFGAVLHPAGMWAHSGHLSDERLFYSEMPQAGLDLILAVDQERLAICRALGLEQLSIESWITRTYPTATGAGLRELMISCPAYGQVTCPPTLSTRYLTEDVPTGLVPMSSIAGAVGVATPLIDRLIAWSSRATAMDLRQEGRGLHRMGIDAAWLSSERSRRMPE